MMNLLKTRQCDLSQITSEAEYDVMIFASGYEERSSFLATTLKKYGKVNYIIKFPGSKPNPRFKLPAQHMKAQEVECNGDSAEKIYEILDNICLNFAHENLPLRIMVDYSSMTRVWYAAIVYYFKFRYEGSKPATIVFAYSKAKFVPPPVRSAPNKHVGPIQGFSCLTIPNIPTALIVGLGYEKQRALGLTEYLDAEPYIFYNDSENNDFSSVVVENNMQILESVKPENIFTYPFDNLKYTEGLLAGLCRELKEGYRIVLAPCGPKPFTLLCLLTAIRYDNIDVWRISPGENAEISSRQPDGTLLFYECIFGEIKEEVENTDD
jgi:hypothetical protein